MTDPVHWIMLDDRPDVSSPTRSC